MNNIKSIEVLEAIDIIRRGGVIVLNHNDKNMLYFATQFLTSKLLSFMMKYADGDIRATFSNSLYDNYCNHADNSNTAESYSIIKNIKSQIDKYKKELNINIAPIKTADGGIMIKYSLEEMSIDLSRLAGLYLSGIICELSDEYELGKFINDNNLKVLDIDKFRDYRDKHDSIIEQLSLKPITTEYGTFIAVGFHNTIDNQEAVAIIKGDVKHADGVLVRIHSQCITGDVFGSLRCDCGEQLHSAMRKIDSEGVGAIVYLFQEGRGIGLLNKIKAYTLQDDGYDTVEANIHLGFADDLRDYNFAAQVLRHIGADKVRLLSNNPRKFDGLIDSGITIVERVPIECELHDENKKYMQTKKDKLGHTLHM